MTSVGFPSAPVRWSGLRLWLLAGAGVLAAATVLDQCYFTVGQNERAYVRQFGRVINASAGPIGPGLHFKQPFFTAVDKLPVSIDVFDMGNIDAYTRDAQKDHAAHDGHHAGAGRGRLSPDV